MLIGSTNFSNATNSLKTKLDIIAIRSNNVNTPTNLLKSKLDFIVTLINAQQCNNSKSFSLFPKSFLMFIIITMNKKNQSGGQLETIEWICTSKYLDTMFID